MNAQPHQCCNLQRTGRLNQDHSLATQGCVPGAEGRDCTRSAARR